MRAPVYRHVEGRSTIGGLGLQAFIAVLGVAFLAIQWLPPGSSVLAIAGSYLLLRLSGLGRPPLYWQHLLVFHVRRRWWGSRLSAAARARTPQFPFGPYRVGHLGSLEECSAPPTRSSP
jgi:hypothetical protein